VPLVPLVTIPPEYRGWWVIAPLVTVVPLVTVSREYKRGEVDRF
jgi:hypothetical protein